MMRRGGWLLILVLLMGGCGEADSPEGIGQSLADISLKTLDGNEVPLADFRGRVLVINFWATWCGPCREEMPALQALSDRLDPRHYAVLGVSVDRDLNLVREFLLKYDLSFPQFSDNEMSLSGDRLKVQAFPETLIVDAEGVLRRRILGVRAWKDMSYLNSLSPEGSDG